MRTQRARDLAIRSKSISYKLAVEHYKVSKSVRVKLEELMKECHDDALHYYPNAESLKDAWPSSTKEGEAWAFAIVRERLKEILGDNGAGLKA